MNQPAAATCLCIISHPKKAEFMVVKHTDRWSPPLVMIPVGGSIPNFAKYITDGVLRDYGLKTIALRQIVSTPGYHCVELEMISRKGTKNLRAHWVGAEEYKKNRSSSPGQLDPIAQWLKEKHKGRTPSLRSAWAREGFFSKARHWINHSLERLNIQATGSVEQFDAFNTSSCTLRVPTSEGWVYFRAGSEAPPPEAALTVALARKWPDYIPEPLCVDEKRNWMLYRDYPAANASGGGQSDLAEAAGILARIQLDSQESINEWQELNCPVLELETLSAFAGRLEELSGVLTEGGGVALSDNDIGALAEAGSQLQELCRRLSEYGIPNMLVHTELWPANIIERDGNPAIVDWSGTVIAHPFFSMLKLTAFLEKENGSPPQASSKTADPKNSVESILDAYLDSFSRFGSRDRLLEAMSIVKQLQNLWYLYKWSQAISREEHDTISYQVTVRRIQINAREIIGGQG